MMWKGFLRHLEDAGQIEPRLPQIVAAKTVFAKNEGRFDGRRT